MSRIENVSRNIFWGLLERFIALAVPFITRTVMIYTLGELYSGLNGLFTSILQGLSLTELGISAAITYSMYKPLAEGNTDEVCALLNLNKKAYRSIGFIIFALGLCLIPFLGNLIAGEIPVNINIYVLYLMYLGGTALSYELCSYRMSLVIAIQRNDIISRVQAVIDVVQLCVQLISLFICKNYYMFVICGIMCQLINSVIVAIVSKNMYPIYICKGKVSTSVFSDVKQRVSGMLCQRIGSIVLQSVDMIVISAFLGLKILTIYQNYYYIITSLFGILTILMNSMIATVGNSIVTESIEKNLHDFKTFNFIYVWLITFCTACLLCMYQPFMEIWMGEKLMLGSEIVFLFAVYFFIHKWCDMLFVYLEAFGAWWKTKFIPLIAAIINLTLNLLLIQKIGLAGILISTVVSVFFVYNIGYAVVLFKDYFKDWKELCRYVEKQLIYMIVAGIAVVTTAFLCNLIALNSIEKLFSVFVVCLIVPNLLYLFVFFRTEEFKSMKALIKRVIESRYIKNDKNKEIHS